MMTMMNNLSSSPPLVLSSPIIHFQSGLAFLKAWRYMLFAYASHLNIPTMLPSPCYENPAGRARTDCLPDGDERLSSESSSASAVTQLRCSVEYNHQGRSTLPASAARSNIIIIIDGCFCCRLCHYLRGEAAPGWHHPLQH